MTQKKKSSKWDWLFKDLSGSDDNKSEEEMQEIKSEYTVFIIIVALIILSLLISTYLINHMSPFRKTNYDKYFGIVIAFDIFLAYYYIQRSRKRFFEKARKNMSGDKSAGKFWIVKKIGKDDENGVKDGLRIASYKINKYVVLIVMVGLTERILSFIRNKKVMDILTRKSSMWIMALLAVLFAVGKYLFDKDKEKRNKNKI
ncbi:MAG: hypothetical protein JXA60_05120 [Candidatus Coatesbacteria bacterium]|nr:hypothetical protein [Candidatus Coatesbacteria bacterium]